jgi:hypothetical protein
MMDKKLIKGSDLVVLQVLNEKLNRLNEEAQRVYSALDKTVQDIGYETIGKPTGEIGQFILTQEGQDVFVSWNKEEEPSHEEDK